MTENSDPTLERIRRTRHEISEACDHDPYKLVAYYMRLQEQHKDRLVDTAEPVPAQQSAA